MSYPHVTKELTVELTVEDIADVFCEMDDDQQSQFFVRVADHMANTKDYNGTMQVAYIAHHLASCDCVTREAREWIETLCDSMREEMKGRTKA